MKYVYILESRDSEHFYVGMTDDLRARLRSTMPARSRILRNTGLGGSRPTLRSATKTQAFAFEKYLKSGSGRAFAKKRLL